MPDFSALTKPPVFKVELNEDETIATFTYEGYFTDGTNVRFGRAVSTQSALIDVDPTRMADLQSDAYEDAFPPGP
jgi:hypothetical protein